MPGAQWLGTAYSGAQRETVFLSDNGGEEPMFMAAQFTIAKIWKQAKCPLTDDWIKKLWFIYTMEYYSAFKKK